MAGGPVENCSFTPLHTQGKHAVLINDSLFEAHSEIALSVLIGYLSSICSQALYFITCFRIKGLIKINKSKMNLQESQGPLDLFY